MGVENKITIPKSQSKNSNCKVTTKWEEANEVILFTTQNGGALITDEIPGGGNVKQRVTIQEKLIQNSTLLSTNSASSAVTITSSSEISRLSQHSYEENHDVQKSQSRIPIRSDDSASSSSNNLSSCSSLFNLHQKSGQKKNPIYFCNFKINRDKREVLISEDHFFVLNIKKQEIIQQLKTANKTKECQKFEIAQFEKYKDIKLLMEECNLKDEKSRINSAISFPGSVRINKLTNTEISELELQLGEQKLKILGARV